ncbi:MAG: Holliday junction branch migration protein RuvA [Acidimicrobiaceae bacterium]|nr:Holliday junction branch migration protein RuvA [Acidimicrobiaceae bacterium]
MIGSLRGVLLDRAARRDGSAEILVEVGGVGYRVVVPGATLTRLGDLGEGVFLHVHTHVREDALLLYGFSTRDERLCFEALIAAHGVGPAAALGMLSVHSPTALRRAVATDDVEALTMVPGIGPKTAARLVVELKSKLEVEADAMDLVPLGQAPDGSGVRGEVRAALSGLGYAADEIRMAVGRLPDTGTVEDLLRHALQELAAAR